MVGLAQLVWLGMQPIIMTAVLQWSHILIGATVTVSTSRRQMGSLMQRCRYVRAARCCLSAAAPGEREDFQTKSRPSPPTYKGLHHRAAILFLTVTVCIATEGSRQIGIGPTLNEAIAQLVPRLGPTE
ncbi:hypothetical protein EYF80_022423 [Liparis tanakae]|uniref:Uncharacterized protein n=1 Tax=Liparis tanakae TaxID=230148 RepID=A0A4Z2HN85_9TELE|nr:hypothetical protein EYF80_022423 [Liparis tanakae]